MAIVLFSLSIMTRHSIACRCVALVALVALSATATAVAWSVECSDGCQMDDHTAVAAPTQAPDAHGCCPDEEPSDSSQFLALSCCGDDSSAVCGGARVLLPEQSGSTAHDRARAVTERLSACPALAITVWLDRFESPERPPDRPPDLPVGSSSLDERYTTETTVLLI